MKLTCIPKRFIMTITIYSVRLHVYVTTDALNCSERENFNDDIEQKSENNIILRMLLQYGIIRKIDSN